MKNTITFVCRENDILSLDVDGVKINVNTTMIHISDNSKPAYEAVGTDDDGNEYLFVWFVQPEFITVDDDGDSIVDDGIQTGEIFYDYQVWEQVCNPNPDEAIKL